MKDNVFRTMIISVMAGIFLSMGSLAYSGEQSADKPEAKPAESVAVKPVDNNPASEEGVSINLRIPFFSTYFEETPVATVDEEQITVRELRKALVSVHEKKAEEKEKTEKKSFLDTLQRLINARLAVLEARSIELDKLPEIKAALDMNADKQLRQTLFEDHVKDIKPDEKEVDKLYRGMIREWKLKSIAFPKESDAKKFEEDLKSGKSFDELRDLSIKAGLADKAGQDEQLYASKDSLGPFLGEAVSKLKTGDVSPVIQMTNAFLIVKVEDSRSIENPELNAKAHNQVLTRMRLESLKKFKVDLYKKYVHEDEKLMKKLDFESPKPGLAKLLKDKRTIANIKGDKPITIADLAEAIKAKYYHGIENAIKEKKVNRDKLVIFDDMISQRVFKRAALDKGLDKSEDYQRSVRDHENTVLFGTFIEKVIKPDVEIKKEELTDYYNNHVSEFVFPEMMQMEDIAFKSSDDAQAAIEKLRKGMDFKWLKNNADNQVEKDSPALLLLSGKMLSVKSFPEQLQKALDGAKSGDYRFYGSPEGIYYVLFVANAVPSRTQVFDEVKNDIAQKVAWENFTRDMEVWFKKLREAYPVKIYLQEKQP
jgi:parvulin-like peptidyl-prolyl isomerase